MLRSLRPLAFCAAIALFPAPVTAHRLIAQGAVPASGPQTAPPSTAAPATQALRRSALPADGEPAPPRTLRAYRHVWIAFTLVWLFVFGYALSLGRRFRRLEAEVESLRATA